MKQLSINKWAEDDRPREKLITLGAQSLSNAELLAILIGSGSVNESAVDLMKRVMNNCNNNLNSLGKMSIDALTSYKGIGTAKAVSIIAACELGKRRQLEKAEEREKITSSEDIYQLMLPQMQDLYTEEMWILLLNNQYKLIKKERISAGGLTQTSVDVRIIIKQALLNNATVIAICHNHPSQNIFPSVADDNITNKVSDACKLMNIHLLDHVIVTDGAFYSYRDHAKL